MFRKIYQSLRKCTNNLHISKKKQYLCITNEYFTYSKLAENTQMKIGYKGSKKNNINQIKL